MTSRTIPGYLVAFSVLLGLALSACVADSGIGSHDEPLRAPDFIAVADASQTVPRSPDRGNQAVGYFWLQGNDGKLKYRIEFDGLDVGGIKGEAQTPNTDDDVTKVHLHTAPRGVAGPHVLNVFGAPTEDDANMHYRPRKDLITGKWDDGDENRDLPHHAQSRTLTESLDELCAGEVYLNIHSNFFGPGELRGQLEPVSNACD